MNRFLHVAAFVLFSSILAMGPTLASDHGGGGGGDGSDGGGGGDSDARNVGIGGGNEEQDQEPEGFKPRKRLPLQPESYTHQELTPIQRGVKPHEQPDRTPQERRRLPEGGDDKLIETDPRIYTPPVRHILTEPKEGERVGHEQPERTPRILLPQSKPDIDKSGPLKKSIRKSAMPQVPKTFAPSGPMSLEFMIGNQKVVVDIPPGSTRAQIRAAIDKRVAEMGLSKEWAGFSVQEKTFMVESAFNMSNATPVLVDTTPTSTPTGTPTGTPGTPPGATGPATPTVGTGPTGPIGTAPTGPAGPVGPPPAGPAGTPAGPGGAIAVAPGGGGGSGSGGSGGRGSTGGRGGGAPASSGPASAGPGSVPSGPLGPVGPGLTPPAPGPLSPLLAGPPTTPSTPPAFGGGAPSLPPPQTITGVFGAPPGEFAGAGVTMYNVGGMVTQTGGRWKVFVKPGMGHKIPMNTRFFTPPGKQMFYYTTKTGVIQAGKWLSGLGMALTALEIGNFVFDVTLPPIAKRQVELGGKMTVGDAAQAVWDAAIKALKRDPLQNQPAHPMSRGQRTINRG